MKCSLIVQLLEQGSDSCIEIVWQSLTGLTPALVPKDSRDTLADRWTIEQAFGYYIGMKRKLLRTPNLFPPKQVLRGGNKII